MNTLPELDEEERRERRARRREEMRRMKEQQMRRRQLLKKAVPFAGGGVAILVLCLIVGILLPKQNNGKTDESVKSEKLMTEAAETVEINMMLYNGAESVGIFRDITVQLAEAARMGTDSVVDEEKGTKYGGNGEQGGNVAPYSAEATDSTVQLGGEIVSNYAVLIDLSTDTIIARKAADTRMNPASMTKVMTVLVAAEHIASPDDTFTMTIDITDYSFVHDCSNVGFEVGEVIPVKDLFYGTILPSGADAAVGLATYVAGSQEAFVEMMNEKLQELGLSQTAHFTNCVGLYDENHYCTVYDMAVILKAAMDNELCREVLSAHTYTTTPTSEHPEGITISNWFLRRIEDKDTGGEVVGAKTGYVVQSGNCAASYAQSSSGKSYICVTADATSGWKCIYDHVALYKEYME